MEKRIAKYWTVWRGDYVEDEDAFIFNIRSSQGYIPKISYVKKDHVSKALRHSTNNEACLMFGCQDLCIYMDKMVFADAEWRKDYDPFPNIYYFLGKECDTLKAIEIYQFLLD